MKNLQIILIALCPLVVIGQSNSNATDKFTVKGKIKNELTFTMADLQSAHSKSIGDVSISNHLGEIKYTAKNLKGILVKELLSPMELDAESPKALSEYYFTFVANDGYKVIFSWNEIFNSPTGESLFIVTSKDGKELKDMNDRMLTVCTTDYKTGRRFVKGLREIIVQRVP